MNGPREKEKDLERAGRIAAPGSGAAADSHFGHSPYFCVHTQGIGSVGDVVGKAGYRDKHSEGQLWTESCCNGTYTTHA